MPRSADAPTPRRPRSRRVARLALLAQVGLATVALAACGGTTDDATASGLVDPATPDDAQPAASTGGSWQRTFSDEFSTGALDRSKWHADDQERTRDDRRDGIRVFYESRLAKVTGRGDGELELGIDRRSCPAPASGTRVGKGQRGATCYGGARVNSARAYDFRFGYVEMRAEMPPTEGHLGALWFTSPRTTEPGGRHDGTARDGAEVDMVESSSKKDRYDVTLHYDGYGAAHKISTQRVPAPGIHDGHHVYGMQWSPQAMRFYYDGRLVRTITDPKLVTQAPLYALMSHELFGQGDLRRDPLDAGSDMFVDYVRIWQRPAGAGESASAGTVSASASVRATRRASVVRTVRTSSGGRASRRFTRTASARVRVTVRRRPATGSKRDRARARAQARRTARTRAARRARFEARKLARARAERAADAAAVARVAPTR